jgi:hypothetical protein
MSSKSQTTSQSHPLKSRRRRNRNTRGRQSNKRNRTFPACLSTLHPPRASVKRFQPTPGRKQRIRLK